MIPLRKRRSIDSFTDFLPLESPRRSEDGDFGHFAVGGEGIPLGDLAFLECGECGIRVEELEDFLLDHFDVDAKVVEREAVFDELLLFHEHVVGAVVDLE